MNLVKRHLETRVRRYAVGLYRQVGKGGIVECARRVPLLDVNMVENSILGTESAFSDRLGMLNDQLCWFLAQRFLSGYPGIIKNMLPDASRVT